LRKRRKRIQEEARKQRDGKEEDPSLQKLRLLNQQFMNDPTLQMSMQKTTYSERPYDSMSQFGNDRALRAVDLMAMQRGPTLPNIQLNSSDYYASGTASLYGDPQNLYDLNPYHHPYSQHHDDMNNNALPGPFSNAKDMDMNYYPGPPQGMIDHSLQPYSMNPITTIPPTTTTTSTAMYPSHGYPGPHESYANLDPYSSMYSRNNSNMNNNNRNNNNSDARSMSEYANEDDRPFNYSVGNEDNGRNKNNNLTTTSISTTTENSTTSLLGHGDGDYVEQQRNDDDNDDVDSDNNNGGISNVNESQHGTLGHRGYTHGNGWRDTSSVNDVPGLSQPPLPPSKRI